MVKVPNKDDNPIVLLKYQFLQLVFIGPLRVKLFSRERASDQLVVGLNLLRLAFHPTTNANLFFDLSN